MEIVHITAIRTFLVPLCVPVEMVSSSLRMQGHVLVSYSHDSYALTVRLIYGGKVAIFIRMYKMEGFGYSHN